MIAFCLTEFFTCLITLIHSFRFAFERPLNVFNQNLGFSKICLHDWLICAHSFKFSISKFLKTFSARCWKPGLLTILSISAWAQSNQKFKFIIAKGWPIEVLLYETSKRCLFGKRVTLLFIILVKRYFLAFLRYFWCENALQNRLLINRWCC